MLNNRLDAEQFRRMIVAGANRLEANKKEVDELNVFPVPDGDTGTNMSLTVMSAAREVLKTGDDASVEAVAKALSSGALRGARGNSGVIVSQLFRGMYRGLRGTEEIDAAAWANAMRQGVETAYKAVMRPKEGTILTVARGMAEAAVDAAIEEEDLAELLKLVIERGEEVLEKTPDMLPVLKEAGVVDAGGKGLLYIYKGMYEALTDENVSLELMDTTAAKKEEPTEGKAPAQAQAAFNTESITYGYCTEFIVHCAQAEQHEEMMRSYLSSIGDSLVVVADDDLIKIHVHTNDPGLAIQKGLSIGYLSNMKIDNMRLQHQNLLVQEMPQETEASVEEAPAEHKEYGFIAVSMGEGLTKILKELGVDQVITGGQTMNPSTEDVLNAIEKINADHIFILPNNKNIILAAQQAAALIQDKEILVVQTRNVPQGITAMLNFASDFSAEENLKMMEEAIQEVHTGMTTFAIRDTHLGDFEIHKDDILGMLDGELSVVDQDVDVVSKELIDRLVEMDKELFTVYYGEDATQDSAQALADYIMQKMPEGEVEVHDGGQPLYHYIISAE
ncbi:MAG: DAK2 domain-containing protein [Lachnospirales bacterium]